MAPSILLWTVTSRGWVLQEVQDNLILKKREISFRFCETPDDQSCPRRFAIWLGLLHVFSWIFFNKTHQHVAAEQQQNSRTLCSKGVKVGRLTREGLCGLSLPWPPLSLPSWLMADTYDEQRQSSVVSVVPLVCGLWTDPGPDLAPQLFAFWRPATWSLFKWTSCLFFLHIGFSSIWKQNSSPSACFWDRHNCMEDNWRQLNLRKTLLIRSTVSINVCISSFLLNGACVPASFANAGVEINERHMRRRGSTE